jgi:hypothetical protein
MKDFKERNSRKNRLLKSYEYKLLHVFDDTCSHGYDDGKVPVRLD